MYYSVLTNLFSQKSIFQSEFGHVFNLGIRANLNCNGFVGTLFSPLATLVAVAIASTAPGHHSDPALNHQFLIAKDL